jgi:hypothetical protein
MNPDDFHKFPLDHPARLLMIAHRRLASAPVGSNGIKSVVLAAYGDYAVRLSAFVPGTMTKAGPSLWVDLRYTCDDRTLNGAGCTDLPEAIAAAEDFLAEAKILNAENQD